MNFLKIHRLKFGSLYIRKHALEIYNLNIKKPQ